MRVPQGEDGVELIARALAIVNDGHDFRQMPFFSHTRTEGAGGPLDSAVTDDYSRRAAPGPGPADLCPGRVCQISRLLGS